MKSVIKQGFFSFIVTLALFSCNHQKDEAPLLIDNTLQSEAINSALFFDSIGLQRLETPMPKLLVETAILRTYRGWVYQLDGYKAKRLNVFNFKGEYITSVDQASLYEGLFVESQVTDVDVDETGVYVLVSNPSLIINYTHNFMPVDTIRLDFTVHSLRKLPNGGFLLYKTLQAKNQESAAYFHHLLQIDAKGKVVRTYMPFSIPEGPRTYLDMNEPFGQDMSRNVVFTRALNDTLYTFGLDNGVLLGKKRIQLKHPILSEKEFPQMQELVSYISQPENPRPFGLGNYQEDANTLSFVLGQHAKSVFYIQHKESNQVGFGTYIASKEMGGHLPIPLYKEEEHFVAILDENILSRLPIDKGVSDSMQKIYDDVLNNGASYVVYYRTKKNSSSNP